MTLTAFSLRDERYKFIRYYGVWDPDELFDLTVDPAEMNKLLTRRSSANHARR